MCSAFCLPALPYNLCDISVLQLPDSNTRAVLIGAARDLDLVCVQMRLGCALSPAVHFPCLLFHLTAAPPPERTRRMPPQLGAPAFTKRRARNDTVQRSTNQNEREMGRESDATVHRAMRPPRGGAVLGAGTGWESIRVRQGRDSREGVERAAHAANACTWLPINMQLVPAVAKLWCQAAASRAVCADTPAQVAWAFSGCAYAGSSPSGLRSGAAEAVLSPGQRDARKTQGSYRRTDVNPIS